ncbi:MAG: hypothetical protein EBQ99_06045 [Planctomycetes bacterium]|nr:hypothetical protein [Planctomycetota bacterium]
MTLPAFVDFLPDATRGTVRLARSRRRTALLALLLLALTLGASVHSLNSARRAEAAKTVGLRLVSNQMGVEEVLDRMAAERNELERALRITDGFVPSITPSAVVATITHLMPERIVLTGVRIAAEDSPRQLTVLLRGHAAGTTEVQQLQTSLAGHPAFHGVAISESRAAEVQQRRVQEFSIGFQVPLTLRLREDREIRRPEAIQ